MAKLTGSGEIFEGDTTTVHSSALHTVGTKANDSSGNQYVYIQGTASVSAGSWVTYDLNNSGAATLLAANAVGPVAIFGTAVVAGQYGWAQIYGVNTVAKSDTTAANKALYIDATAGRVDDAGVAGDLVLNACSLTADTSNVLTVHIAYPFVLDGGYLT